MPLQHEFALGEGVGTPRAARRLTERFIVPPFTVLDARQGYWQARKRAWLALGIRSELGRGENALGLSAECEAYRQADGDYSKSGAVQPTGSGLAAGQQARREQERAWAASPNSLASRHERARAGDAIANCSPKPPASGLAQKCGQDLMRGEYIVGSTRHDADMASNLNGEAPLPNGATATGTANMATGTSIFDPVLCELVYRWFCPPGGAILDPFAGGSVRGIVAAWLGYQYVGIDLRSEQCAANATQAAAILTAGQPQPSWLVGDSRDVPTLLPAGAQFDCLFTCPPYHNLEVYSDDLRDLSNAGEYEDFLAGLGICLRRAVARLRTNRFAALVVGNVRDGKGRLHDLAGDTTRLMAGAGCALVNDGVLVTAVGSLPIRVSGQFDSGRKLGRTHQQCLVYAKGDPMAAARACVGSGDERTK